MTLKFNPEPYLAAFQAQRQDDQIRQQQLEESLNQIPKGIGAVADYQNQQKQQRMQELLLGQKAQESGNEPNSWINYANNGAMPKPSIPQDTLSPEAGQSLMPTMRPGQGLEASAGVQDAPRMQPSPSPVLKSPIVAMSPWKSANQEQPQASGLFTKKPFDVNGIIKQLQSGDASALANLNDRQMKQLEATPAYIQMKKKDDLRTPGQVSALFPHLNVAALSREYPNGIPKEDLAFISSGLKADVTSGEKSNQFYQKEWDKIVKEVSPLGATSRSGLGMATRADYNANRALNTISKKTVTNQEAHNVMADMASIYQNGSATEYGMSQQAYDSLYGRVQNLIQLVSGNPQDAVPDGIKERLINDLNEMKLMNKDVMKQHFDYYESAQPDVIDKFRPQWNAMRSKYERGVSGVQPIEGQKSPVQFDPEKEKRYQAWKAKQMGGGQ